MSKIRSIILGTRTSRHVPAVTLGFWDTIKIGLIMRQYELPKKASMPAGTTSRLLEAVLGDGFLDFVIDQQPYLQGFYTVMEMFAYTVSGGLIGPADIDTGLKFVTKDSIDQYLSTKTRYEGSAKEAQIAAQRRDSVAMTLNWGVSFETGT